MTATNPDLAAHLDTDECARFQELFEIIGKRWTVAIVIAAAQGSSRFGEFRDNVHGVSERLLAERLKELTARGVLERCVEGEPPVIRYRLTECGTDLVEQLGPVISWAERWQ
jgi:DNA-binding HxlR family transcriptional regulator